jgi:hypothetical protein
MATLVYYGNNNLQNSRFTGSSNDGAQSSSDFQLERIPLARGIGSIPVSSRVEEKQINLTGYVKGATQGEFLDNVQVLKTILNYENQFLRFIPTYTEINTCDLTTGFTASDDAANLTADTDDFQYNDTSLKFDIDVSASANDYATITGSITSVDLSSVAEDGNIEFWIYLPAVTGITDINFRIGSDSSNYYSKTFNTNYQEQSLQQGWNLLSMKWDSDTSVTGTPSNSAIDYVYVRINHTLTEDLNGCRLDAFLWVDEERLRNFPSYRLGSIDVPGDHWVLTNSPYSVSFVNYTGLSQSTHSFTLLDKTGVTATTTDTVTLDGSFAALPLFDVNINSGTNLDSIKITNITTTQNIVFSDTFVALDNFLFGGEDFNISKNGNPVAFSGQIPDFRLGKNQIRLELGTTGATSTSQTSGSNEYTYTTSTTPDRKYIYQSFTAPATGDLSDVSVLTRQVYSGGGAGTPYEYPVWILGDDGTGKPDWSNDLQSGFVTPTTSGTATYASVVWSGSVSSVTNGSRYHIAINTQVFIPPDLLYWTASDSNPLPSEKSHYSATQSTTIAEEANRDFCFDLTVQPTPSYNLDYNLSYKKLRL